MKHLLFLISCFFCLSAWSRDFFTNLDEPKVIVSTRDSVNYKFSKSVLVALKKINQSRPQDQKIMYLTYGKNNSLEEYLNEYENRSTSERLSLPTTPFVDLRKENQKYNYSWFQHIYVDAVQWMQDSFEFFSLNGQLNVLSFHTIFSARNFLTPEQIHRMKIIGALMADDKTTDTEFQKIQEESWKILERARILAQNQEQAFYRNLGVHQIQKIEGVDVDGGDFEALPGNVILTSLSEHDGVSSLEKWLAQGSARYHLISMDADWLTVGHVDELVTVIPSGQACGFSILIPDAQLGAELIQRQSERELKNWLPADYQSSTAPGTSIYEKLEPFYFALVQPPNDVALEFKNFQDRVQKRIESSIAHVLLQYQQFNPQCGQIEVLRVPTLFECADRNELEECRTLLPNPINALVLKNQILVPDPFLPAFKNEITRVLRSRNIQEYFVDTGFYHGFGGEAHCATNVLRQKSQTQR